MSPRPTVLGRESVHYAASIVALWRPYNFDAAYNCQVTRLNRVAARTEKSRLARVVDRDAHWHGNDLGGAITRQDRPTNECVDAYHRVQGPTERTVGDVQRNNSERSSSTCE